MNAAELNSEVFVATEPLVEVTARDIALLKERAAANPRRKCRLLLHRHPDEALHEMVIVHARGRYIRPHRNDRSAKSYTLLDGKVVCLVFDDDGAVTGQYRLATYPTGGAVMLRLSSSCFHTLIPLTEQVVIVETILGPFRGTTYARWAPEEGHGEEARKYFASLCRLIESEKGNCPLEHEGTIPFFGRS